LFYAAWQLRLLRAATRILNAEHHLTEFVVTDRYLQRRLAARPEEQSGPAISSSDQVISIRKEVRENCSARI
jgi:hypothetical protein